MNERGALVELKLNGGKPKLCDRALTLYHCELNTEITHQTFYEN